VSALYSSSGNGPLCAVLVRMSGGYEHISVKQLIPLTSVASDLWLHVIHSGQAQVNIRGNMRTDQFSFRYQQDK